MVNPLKVIYDYYERSGVRRDIPVMKRMFIEAPHLPIGIAVSVASMAGAYVYLKYFYNYGIGYQTKFTVMRSDDPRLLKFKEEIRNADKIASS